MNLQRISGIFLRQLYLYKRSLPRLMGIVYWPLLDLLLWGFITLYLNKFRQDLPAFVGFFLGALILWDILFRAQQGISVSFLEDMWARNLLNIFITPVTVGEYLVALMLVSLAKVICTASLSIFVAWIFYSFNMLKIGIYLLPFILNLIIMGWAIGLLTTALILRFGQQAEVLAWGIAFLFQPVSAVFYPVSVLPSSLRLIARFVPSSHVFEGMRSVIGGGGFPAVELLWAAALNMVYLCCSLLFFYKIYSVVKTRGLLAKTGE